MILCLGIIGYFFIGFILLIIGTIFGGKCDSRSFFETSDKEGTIPAEATIILWLLFWPAGLNGLFISACVNCKLLLLFRKVLGSIIRYFKRSNIKQSPKEPSVCDTCHQKFYKKGEYR